MRGVSVASAQALILAKVPPPVRESVGLADAKGRVLLAPIAAQRDQPPFRASAMDGWAIAGEGADAHAPWIPSGESAAGGAFAGTVGPGEAVRIFTGAPVPPGADRVIIQEDAVLKEASVHFQALGRVGDHIRPQGGDFRAGQVLVAQGQRLEAGHLALAAAAGAARLTVARKPKIAILATGAELVSPGGRPRPDQIFKSASFALIAKLIDWGADAIRLPAAGDDEREIACAVEQSDAEIVITIGGASVGDHDLVKPALARLGLELVFETVNVRPGKPTWFGHLADGRTVLGLPGNPASAFVCAELFARPLVVGWLGARTESHWLQAHLLQPLAANAGREHYLRAQLAFEDARLMVQPFTDQDSSLITRFVAANALVVRPPMAPAAGVGNLVDLLRL